MAIIANLTVKADGSFEGMLATLNVTAQIAIIPNGRKAKDSESVINTDRRTYHVELRATAAAYMASVSWTYPADELIALKAAEAEAARAAPVAGAIDLAAVRHRRQRRGRARQLSGAGALHDRRSPVRTRRTAARRGQAGARLRIERERPRRRGRS